MSSNGNIIHTPKGHGMGCACRACKFPNYADAARLAHTLGKPIMTAAERNKQRDAYIAAVDGMATVLRETVARVDAAERCCQERWNESAMASKRHGDRHQAFVSASFMARLRWLLTGR